MRLVKYLLLVSLIGAVCMTTYGGIAVPSRPPGAGWVLMSVTRAREYIDSALELKEKAHSLLDQAMEADLDVEGIEALISLADALLGMAEKIANSLTFPAANMANAAAHLYENAMSDLEALLG